MGPRGITCIERWGDGDSREENFRGGNSVKLIIDCVFLPSTLKMGPMSHGRSTMHVVS
ncbi:hypothetical protein PanWU01x14_184900 [Parasponia andersonii]|uniref:Uncharacterized protein n=1 Tax=Parasponia andersonii TaxID=3476 RepID=A0A2P5C4H3_PARAD|nr:hypothetical protein PanWU01x14_184900 [Parasponia andersonii]